jgi:hypothetical protein
MVTCPLALFQRISGLGHNSVYRHLENGEYDSIIVGAYRLIMLSTFHAFLERKRLGLERDPIERAAAIASFRTSLETSRGAKAAARARGGRGRGIQVPPAGKARKTAVAQLVSTTKDSRKASVLGK